MDSCGEDLNKRQSLDEYEQTSRDLPSVWCENELLDNEDRACSMICFKLWSLFVRLDK